MFETTYVHQCTKVDFFVVSSASRITSFLLSTLSKCHAVITSSFFSIPYPLLLSHPDLSSLEKQERACEPRCNESSISILCLRCGLHDFSVEMIPNAVSWTHELRRCIHASSLESCSINHSSIQFLEAQSASLFFFCKASPSPLELPTISCVFDCFYIHHFSDQWIKWLWICEHSRVWTSRLPVLVSLSSERAFPLSNQSSSKKPVRGNSNLSHADYVTTYAIFLKASLSCTSLKTMKHVIKTIIKDRSPTMRHVSRTHRGSWLVVWWNQCGPQNPNQTCWHQKKQLADMSTKGSFTRDKWDHHFRLFNIMNFSMFSCRHFFKQEAECHVQKNVSREGSPVVKPSRMNLVSRNLLSAKKDLRKIRVLRTVQESRIKTQRQDTDAKHQPNSNNVFSREATRWHSISVSQKTGDGLSSSSSTRKLERGRTSKSEDQRWNSLCRSPSIDTSRKSSRTFEGKCIDRTIIHCWQRWKSPFILD